MTDYKIRRIFELSYEVFSVQGNFQTDVQYKAAHAILNCKSGKLGFNLSRCTRCGHMEIHKNSCRNRSCPNCQAVQKEIWVDKRRAEVIKAPYFHVVFTLPHELNPLIYCNQKLLYGLLHRCCAETLLELSASKKWLGATPGIIQVLHTWNQELDYHVHMHCIVSGGGLTKDGKLRRSSKNFFIRTEVLRDKFKGKYIACLSSLYKTGALTFLLPARRCVIHTTGQNGKTAFMKRTGALTSSKPLTVLAMPLNTWGDILTRSPSLTAESFPLQKIRLHSLPVAKNQAEQNGKLH